MKTEKSISKKIVIIILFTVLLVLVPFELMYYYQQKREEIQKVNHQADTIIERISNSIAYPYWILNNSEIRKTIILELANINAKAIILKNEKNKLTQGFIKNSKGEISKITNSSSEKLKKESLTYRIKPVKWQENIVGKVELYISSQNLDKNLNSIVLRIAGMTIILTFFIFGAIIFSLNLIILKPVLILDKYVNKFAETRDFTVKVPILRKDELGRLANSFNELIHQLKRNYNRRTKLMIELNEKNEKLRQEIKNRKIAQESLYLSEMKYTNLFDNMLDAYVNLDINGKIIDFNPAFKEISFFEKKEIKGVSIDSILKEDFLGNERIKKRILDLKKISRLETQLIRKDSTLVPVEVSCYLDLDKDEEPTGFWVIIRNIEDRKKSEKQLLRAQKMETVGHLAGGLAHDFNNVLGGIIGTTSLLKFIFEDDKPLDRNEIKENIELVNQSAKRASKLVKQLLTISKRNEISLVSVDLCLLIERVWEVCERTFDKSVEIEINFEEKPAYITGDASQIEQAILNLMMNGYHAMTIMNQGKHSGGILRVNLDKESYKNLIKTMPNKAIKEGSFWKLEIEDEGVGIAEEDFNKIFDPFFSTKDKSEGTGLGLSMVYNIIQKHEGYIYVESERGKGTTFTVWLPVNEKANKEIQLEEKQDSVKMGEGLILVIDDEYVIRKVLRNQLQQLGYEVLCAETPEIGIEKYQSNKDKIDLVILDMVMPKMTGEEVYNELKRINRDVLVLMASGFKQDKRVERSIKNGVNAFIQKPFTLKKLSLAINKLLGKTN